MPEYKTLKQFKQKYDPVVIDQIFSMGRQYGYSDAQLAAMAANAMFESGHVPTASNGTHYGLFQWSNRQRSNFNNTVKSQLNYVFTDAKRGRWPQKGDNFNGWDPRYYKTWINPKATPSQLAAAFNDGYERNGLKEQAIKRGKAAEIIYKVKQGLLSLDSPEVQEVFEVPEMQQQDLMAMGDNQYTQYYNGGKLIPKPKRRF